MLTHTLLAACPGLHHRSGEERPGTCACAALREHELLLPAIAALAAPSRKRSATCAGRVPPGRTERREIPRALAKAKAALAAVGNRKATGQRLDRKGTVAEKGKRAQEPLVGTGHQKFRVACINLGGWRKRIKYVYEWNMWNMLADLFFAAKSTW